MDENLSQVAESNLLSTGDLIFENINFETLFELNSGDGIKVDFFRNPEDLDKTTILSTLLKKLQELGPKEFFEVFLTRGRYQALLLSGASWNKTLRGSIYVFKERTSNSNVKLIFFYLYKYLMNGNLTKDFEVKENRKVKPFDRWLERVTKSQVDEILTLGSIWSE